MLLKVPRQNLKMEMVWRWYQSPRLGIRPEVWSLVNPDLTAKCKSFTKESCRGLLQQFRLLWPRRWMLLNDWFTQLLCFSTSIYGLWKPVPWPPRNPLALLDCTVWANHLPEVWSWKQFRSRFFCCSDSVGCCLLHWKAFYDRFMWVWNAVSFMVSTGLHGLLSSASPKNHGWEPPPKERILFRRPG